MSVSAELTKVTIVEGSASALLARMVNLDGDYLTQSSVASIAFTVYDLGAAGAQSSAGTFVVASTVFNSLQTGLEWTRDDTGYNFRGPMEASHFPTGGRQYLVVLGITPTSGDVIWKRWEYTVLENPST